MAIPQTDFPIYPVASVNASLNWKNGRKGEQWNLMKNHWNTENRYRNHYHILIVFVVVVMEGKNKERRKSKTISINSKSAFTLGPHEFNWVQRNLTQLSVQINPHFFLSSCCWFNSKSWMIWIDKKIQKWFHQRQHTNFCLLRVNCVWNGLCVLFEGILNKNVNETICHQAIVTF